VTDGVDPMQVRWLWWLYGSRERHCYSSLVIDLSSLSRQVFEVDVWTSY